MNIEDEELEKIAEEMAQEYLKMSNQVFKLLTIYPYELGFVLDSKDYDAYVKTFDNTGDKPILSSEEFWLIRDFYNGYTEYKKVR